MNLPSLAQLLSPFPVEAFIRQFDSKVPVLLRPVLSTPLDLPRLDALVAAGGLRWPTIHLEDASGPIHPDAYTRPIRWGAEPEPFFVDVEALRAGLQAGQRVVWTELQRHHGPTGQLLRAYERAFHMRGRATAVLSPEDAPPREGPASGAHQYLLQCHGARTCTVTSPDGQREDFDLVVGCVVYVPPGHTVTTQPKGGPSLALDFTLQPIRVRDVAVRELRSLPRDRLRGLAPVGQLAPSQALAAAWKDQVDQLLDAVDHTEVVEQLVDRFVQSRLPMLPGQLAASAMSIDPSTPLRRRPSVMYRLVDNGEAVELRFHGKAIPFPRGAEELVQFLAESPRWTPADIDGVTPAQQLAIARTLVVEGFCVPV